VLINQDRKALRCSFQLFFCSRLACAYAPTACNRGNQRHRCVWRQGYGADLPHESAQELAPGTGRAVLLSYRAPRNGARPPGGAINSTGERWSAPGTPESTTSMADRE